MIAMSLMNVMDIRQIQKKTFSGNKLMAVKRMNVRIKIKSHDLSP